MANHSGTDHPKTVRNDGPGEMAIEVLIRRRFIDDQALLTGSIKDLIPKRPAKTGTLKKFFAWIARGASQSSIGNTSCPA